MCLIFLALHRHPVYKLVLAGNRDEFYARPTAPADFWPDNNQILGGRDLAAGGTWLAATVSGKLAMLTNYRDPRNMDPKAPSRGRLVTDFLESPVDAAQYLDAVNAGGTRYNGFNLIAGTADEMYYFSNYHPAVQRLTPGFYGISNKFLDTPWPKVVKAKEKLEHLLETPDVAAADLLDALYDDATAPVERLPDTGVPPDLERALSAMFIKAGNYGTRCSTVVLVDRQDRWHFTERTYNTSDFSYTDRSYHFVGSL